LPIDWPTTSERASSIVLRMLSPPGTSPTPVLPALSCRMTTLRVKNGPCAPLRFSSMLSRPATGTTRSSVTVGVAFDWDGFVDMKEDLLSDGADRQVSLNSYANDLCDQWAVR
jgi:hypothetical protein